MKISLCKNTPPGTPLQTPEQSTASDQKLKAEKVDQGRMPSGGNRNLLQWTEQKFGYQTMRLASHS